MKSLLLILIAVNFQIVSQSKSQIHIARRIVNKILEREIIILLIGGMIRKR